MKKYVTIDVGGTKIKHAVMLEDGTIIEKDEFDTERFELEGFLNGLADMIKNYQKNHEIIGVALSMPGFIHTHTGFCELAGAIDAMHGKNIKELLSAKINLPIEVENDANCVALAEKFNGHATECDDFICFTIGTGIGGGIMVNGQMIRGRSFKAGEIGYMIVDGIHDPEYNTLSEVAATLPLIRFYNRYKGQDIDTKIDGRIIFEEAKTDENVQKIIDTWFDRLAYGVLNLSGILNPQKILIGGGISSREDFLPTLKKHLNKIKQWKDIEVEVDVCKHKNDAGMFGALYHYLSEQGK